MRFLYLTEIGHHYDLEEGTPGVRNQVQVWKGIETALKTAITDLRNLLKTPTGPAPVTGSVGRGSVRDRARFFENKGQANANEVEIAQIKAKIDRLRKWLQMEGAYADKDGNIDLTRFKNLTVVYDHDAARRGMTRVEIKEGQLLLKGQPLHTENMVTHFSGPGKAIYVLSFEGNLHVASHVVGHYHHSSLLAGARVAGAGEIEVSNGHVMWISNKSGHYRPSINHLCQTLHLLQKKGVPMTFRVSVVGAINGNFESVHAFLKALELADEPDYELAKLLCYEKHLTDAVLGTNGWRWRQNATVEKAGVYTIGPPSVLVPHKVVRQWLKSQGFLPNFDLQRGTGR